MPRIGDHEWTSRRRQARADTVAYGSDPVTVVPTPATALGLDAVQQHGPTLRPQLAYRLGGIGQDVVGVGVGVEVGVAAVDEPDLDVVPSLNQLPRHVLDPQPTQRDHGVHPIRQMAQQIHPGEPDLVVIRVSSHHTAVRKAAIVHCCATRPPLSVGLAVAGGQRAKPDQVPGPKSGPPVQPATPGGRYGGGASPRAEEGTGDGGHGVGVPAPRVRLTVAALYGARLTGRSPRDCLTDVQKVLPGAHPNSRMLTAIDRLA